MSATSEDSFGFEFTTDMDFRAQVASIAGSSLSMLLSLFIIGSSAWIYSVPAARHHLDRVSFRLLLCSMVVEVVYNSAYLYIFSDPLPRTENPASCTASVYFLIASMGTANWLCTFIGVNLMLAICFGVNPIRARLERWYYLVSFFMGFGLTIIPAAIGDFGVDNDFGACYFTNTENGERIKDLFVDLYLWQILSSVIAAGSVLAVLITLLRQSRATSRAIFRANGLDLTSQDLRSMAISSTSSTAPIVNEPIPWFRRLLRSKSTEAHSLHRLEDKFVTIALKISLYPLALIIINAFITAEDLVYTLTGGVDSASDYVMYCIYYFLYGGRGMFFALLGIFVDPCLRRGLPAAYKATFRKESPILPVSAVDNDGELGDAGQHESMSDFLSSSWPALDGTPLSISSAKGQQWLGGKGLEKELPQLLFTSPKPQDSTPSVSFHTPTYSQPPSLLPPFPNLTPDVRPGPVHLSTTPPPMPRRPPLTARTDSMQSWIDPLAAAIAHENSLFSERRSSDPVMGDVSRRRRELRLAAEKMYAVAQTQL